MYQFESLNYIHTKPSNEGFKNFKFSRNVFVRSFVHCFPQNFIVRVLSQTLIVRVLSQHLIVSILSQHLSVRILSQHLSVRILSQHLSVRILMMTQQYVVVCW